MLVEVGDGENLNTKIKIRNNEVSGVVSSLLEHEISSKVDELVYKPTYIKYMFNGKDDNIEAYCLLGEFSEHPGLVDISELSNLESFIRRKLSNDLPHLIL